MVKNSTDSAVPAMSPPVVVHPGGWTKPAISRNVSACGDRELAESLARA